MIDFDFLTLNGRDIRVHGNGFIQIDIERDGELGSERVHVFGHPAIPRQVNPTPIHDHRFGFYSTVLVGRLTNTIFNLIAHAEPTHRAYRPSPRAGEDTELVPTDETGVLAVWRTETLLPGQQYSIYPAQLHETLANETTVTHMVKQTTTSLLPRVLCRIDRTPDNSFERYSERTPAQLWDIVEDAFRG